MTGSLGCHYVMHRTSSVCLQGQLERLRMTSRPTFTSKRSTQFWNLPSHSKPCLKNSSFKIYSSLTNFFAIFSTLSQNVSNLLRTQDWKTLPYQVHPDINTHTEVKPQQHQMRSWESIKVDSKVSQRFLHTCTLHTSSFDLSKEGQSHLQTVTTCSQAWLEGTRQCLGLPGSQHFQEGHITTPPPPPY